MAPKEKRSRKRGDRRQQEKTNTKTERKREKSKPQREKERKMTHAVPLSTFRPSIIRYINICKVMPLRQILSLPRDDVHHPQNNLPRMLSRL